MPLFGMNPLPVTGAKIHPPLLRADILSRERLNGWLEDSATGRLALIVAEAGFGKTTLLADWSRKSGRLTAWYRLEPDDRDWLTFIRHLVASGRELEPNFAPETYSLLLQLGPGGPTQAELVASLVRELAEFGSAHAQGFTLIFDDYHVIDRSEETEPIVRAILERTGPGFSVVIASRTAPKLPLGRLRSRGGVSRLDGDALCFDVPEAERLFRDAYHQPLDRDIVTDLIDRTEGWPALLSLVRTNLEEAPARNPRSVIGQLTAAHGDLYDYLAEEVMETLPVPLRQFLTRVSLLDRIDALPISAVDDRDASEIRSLIQDAEQLGLLARPDPTSPHRFHPLVQRFMRDRLESEVGPEGVKELHRRFASALEAHDWRSAASHHLAAGDTRSVERVIDASLERILASGQFEAVRAFLNGSAGNPDRATALILRSRIELARGSLSSATMLAQSACEVAQDTEYAGVALVNLATVLGISGFADDAVKYARDALAHPLTSTQRHVALATVSMWEARHSGDLSTIAERLRALAQMQDQDGHVRYASITRLNLAAVLFWYGAPEESLEVASIAETGLRKCGAPDLEVGAALAAKATALAYLGEDDEAKRLLTEASSAASILARNEAALETAKVLGDLDSLDQATTALENVGPATIDAGLTGLLALVAGQLAIRRGDPDSARQMVSVLAQSPCRDVAGELRGRLLKARVAIMLGKPATAEVQDLRAIADAQQSRIGRLLSDVLGQCATESVIGAEIVQLMPSESALLSWLAEELASRLHLLSPQAQSRVRAEAHRRPARWLTALRLATISPGEARMEAAMLLSELGTAEDVALLRQLATTGRAFKPLAAHISRRLAPLVVVRDLGAVEVRIGGRALDRTVRRKVLGLLCFLTSRPNMVATKDEVLDALWPDLGPDTAGNSLHQTIYFLRRVFEPDFREGYSAGYVHFDGDVVSLDPDLVDSASRQCWALLTQARRDGADVVESLLSRYTGRYALDFAYEEWASDYRDTLHAAVLATIERATTSALEAQAYERAIALAQSMLSLDPTADSVELMLLRTYKASGRHAAAAEQYAHYSSYLRDQLGVDPPRFEDV